MQENFSRQENTDDGCDLVTARSTTIASERRRPLSCQSNMARGAPTSVASSSPMRMTWRNLPSSLRVVVMLLNVERTIGFPVHRRRDRAHHLRKPALHPRIGFVLSITQISASTTSMTWLVVRLIKPIKIDACCEIRKEAKAIEKIKPVSIRKARKFTDRASTFHSGFWYLLVPE